MTRTLSFNEQARSELREAANYYGLESPALRIGFLDAVDAALAQLRAHPESARLAPRQQLIQDYAERVDVRGRGDRAGPDWRTRA